MLDFAWFVGVFLLVVLAIILLGLLALRLASPGKAQPILDGDGNELAGAISTIERVTLGGVTQALIIRGHDASAPVMLFLHGGPGSPEYALLRQTNTGLEEHFVMVYWEQRGAGMSYDKALGSQDMSPAQFIEDTAELALLLSARFGGRKIYLMGHSWGALLGLSTVKAHPQLFAAYFGLGNVAWQLEGERESLIWARARARELGNTRAAAVLDALEVPAPDAGRDAWMAYLRSERGWLDKLGGGMMHQSPGMARMVKWLLVTPEYRLRDKLNYFRGLFFSLANLWEDVITTNLIETTGRVEIPVFLLQGAWDYQTPTTQARALFEAIEAPHKEFVLFAHSAHSPIMEEPAKFNALVRAAASAQA